MIRHILNEVFTTTYFMGFWAVALKFFKFEFVTGIFDSLAPSFYKSVIFIFALIFNIIGAAVFLCLSVLHSLSIVAYIIPKIIISAITNAIGS